MSKPKPSPVCAGSRLVPGCKDAAEVRSNTLRTCQTWPKCPAHGDDLVAGDGALTCPGARAGTATRGPYYPYPPVYLIGPATFASVGPAASITWTLPAGQPGLVFSFTPALGAHGTKP